MDYPPLKQLDIEELLERLEASLADKSLSPADRILEFPNILRALRLVYSSDKKLIQLTSDLLKTVKPYKANLGDPNAATLYRVIKPKEFAEIWPQLEETVRELRAANAAGSSHGSTAGDAVP